MFSKSEKNAVLTANFLKAFVGFGIREKILFLRKLKNLWKKRPENIRKDCRICFLRKCGSASDII
jgi:hypothetical protein